MVRNGSQRKIPGVVVAGRESEHYRKFHEHGQKGDKFIMPKAKEYAKPYLDTFTEEFLQCHRSSTGITRKFGRFSRDPRRSL